MCKAPSNFSNISNITEGDFLSDYLSIDFALSVQKST